MMFPSSVTSMIDENYKYNKIGVQNFPGLIPEGDIPEEAADDTSLAFLLVLGKMTKT